MRFTFTLLIILYSCIASANTITAVTSTATPGDWASSTTWSPATVPQSGDIVMIPSGFGVQVASQPYPNGSNPALKITVGGTLYFKPSGKLDLFSTSSIQILSGGSIVPQNSSSSQLINIGGVTKYNAANNGTVSGPAFANAATGASSSSSSLSGFSTGLLPVHLTQFTAQAEARGVRISWITADEVSTDHFELEKSTDGRSWAICYQQKTYNAPSSYTTLDNNAVGDVVFYRLKTVDQNGSYTYSATVKVKRERGASVFLSPNPAQSLLNISVSQTGTNKVVARIVNSVGQLVKQVEFAAGSNLLSVNIQDLRKGYYTVMIVVSDEVKDSQQLLIQ